MDKFINLFLSGLVTGAIYSIMASGLVLTFQTSGIFNFAHGAVAFATAFVYYQLHVGQGMPIVPAAILSVLVFAPLLGLALSALLFRRLATAPVYARIVGTIGLLVALPALVLWLVEAVGDQALNLDLPKIGEALGGGGTAPGLGPQPPDVYRPFANVNINSDQVAVFIVALVAAFVLWWVIRKTRVGLEMRAVVDRESLATLRGVNPGRTSAFAWTLTMVLAGLGGVLISPLFSLDNNVFTLVVLGSLAAVAAAGLRSLPIAFVGGLALGVIQNLVAGYGDTILPHFLNTLSGFRAAIPFILTLLILFFAGRERGREAGSVADETPATDHREGLPAWRKRLPWAVFTVVLVAFTLQWTGIAALQADSYEQGIIALGLATAIVFLSFVIVTGLGGMVSLAQATFVIAGGFAAGWALNRDWGVDIPMVATHGQLNFAWAALIGAIAAAAIGALVAIPVRRLGPVALALGTFALAFVADLVPFSTQAVGHGSDGWTIRSPSLHIWPFHTWDFSQPQQQAMLMLVLFGVLTLLYHNLLRSTTGRSMLAARSSEVAARMSGISPARVKITVFALSAGVAGLGGVMIGTVNTPITQSSAPPLVGLVWLAVAVTWGVRRPGGALLAGLSFTCVTAIFTWVGHDYLPGTFNDLTTSIYFTSILFGLGAINLAKNPDGLLALIGHQRLEKRRERERLARVEAVESAAHGGELPEHEQLHVSATPAPVTAEPAVSSALMLRDIVAGYGQVEVLHGVSLDLTTHSVVALLGANGAGKSTLCSVASGLVAPESGAVLVGGADVTALMGHDRARAGVLLVPEARGIFPGLSVEENLQVLLRSSEQREAAYERFPILGQRRKQIAGLLSGGEQQMLSLAPALANPPAVFIADEPTLGLAPLAVVEVLHAIDELRSLGCAVLLVAEKAHEVMGLADTIVVMALGEVVWSGAAADTDVEQLSAAYLGSAI